MEKSTEDRTTRNREAVMRTISYRDPTGETAVGNILREERLRKKRERKESRETEETGRDARERWPIRRESA